MDMEKAEVLNDYIASVVTDKGSGCITQALEDTGGEWEKEDLPITSKDQHM